FGRRRKDAVVAVVEGLAVRPQRLARELTEGTQGFSTVRPDPLSQGGLWNHAFLNAELGVSDYSNLPKGAMMISSNCKRRITGAIAALGVTLVSMAAVADPVPWQMNLPKGVTPISHQTWNLHMAALWVCVALGILVFGAMFVAIIRFRHSRGAVAATWRHDTWLEIAWTVVPVLIVVGLAAPATILSRNV